LGTTVTMVVTVDVTLQEEASVLSKKVAASLYVARMKEPHVVAVTPATLLKVMDPGMWM